MTTIIGPPRLQGVQRHQNLKPSLLPSSEVSNTWTPEWESISDDLWKELVRCILAGGPVRGEIAYYCHSWLSRALPKSQTHEDLLDNVQDSLASLSQCLADFGYRFPQAKARSIVSAAILFAACEAILRSVRTIKEAKVLRLVFAKLAWGIGLKTASHWLRNVGWDLPVIDRHVRRYLSRNGARNGGSSLDTGYLDAEKRMETIAEAIGVGPGIFDLHVWHHERRECQSLSPSCYACRLEGVRTWRD